jgi:hypothetical protein
MLVKLFPSQRLVEIRQDLAFGFGVPFKKDIYNGSGKHSQ